MMLLATGCPMLSVVRVHNQLSRKLKRVTFTYNECCIDVKNIKSNHQKQTGISTIYPIQRLLLCVEDEEYLIKEAMPRAYYNNLDIIISEDDAQKVNVTVKESSQ